MPRSGRFTLAAVGGLARVLSGRILKYRSLWDGATEPICSVPLVFQFFRMIKARVTWMYNATLTFGRCHS